MGNRAYLGVYTPSNKFSTEVLAYLAEVATFYKLFKNMDSATREKEKERLFNQAKVVFPDDDYTDLIYGLTNFTKLVHEGKTYYCNDNFFGAFKNALWERKNVVPIEWCHCFSETDKVDEYSYKTTIKKAYARLLYIGGNNDLIEWIKGFDEESIIELTFGELTMNDNFKATPIHNAVAFCGGFTNSVLQKFAF
jgi:hypothetical protein